ncbi:helix-turn-helix domain-containing protein [Enterococcus faecalis]|uniref:helix-turn-helix domain-containing protein n=1 Tax=Enterococcus faecalis TaxID=1351 RepID=UPI002AFF8A67|nr:helix-turn-helix domain-containing protein [Enterococcus faecalis]
MKQNSIDLSRLMTAHEASLKLGKQKDYIGQYWRKYPEKFKEGTIEKIGNTLIITDEGLEYFRQSMGKEGILVIRVLIRGLRRSSSRYSFLPSPQSIISYF